MIKFISWLLWIINRAICSTLKYKVKNEPPGNVLFAFWHGQSFPLFYGAKHRKLCLHPTDNWRGDALDYLAKKYSYRSVRFLEEGTPLQRGENLVNLIKILKQGWDTAIAVDGPPKPMVYHQAKPGIIFLSQKSGLPIVPARIKMLKKFILFWRWDKYEIPLPWSEVEIDFGQPFIADEKTTTQELARLLSDTGQEL